MNPIVYDISMLAGLALSVAGVAVIGGTGPALVAAGVGIIVLTFAGARR